VQLSKHQFAVLSELLDKGLDLPEASRGAWVEGLTEPFTGAKAILRKMLAQEASGEAQNFLTTLPKFPTPGGAPPDSRQTGLQSGARLGVYILIREIGQGGMSTVWLARRTDELVKRVVALKLPHLHLQSARFAERFARERDILANLTHPHIAHLYDAGITSEGQPFLAMEFVAGEPLTRFCTANHLGVDERVQLFLQVLEAVEQAHAQSVIHRDLKPSNILVREGGDVVLLDFGIAKLLVDGHSEQTELTLHGGAALTPHYASPEQIRGDTLGPATDIYSLGVLLYELLSGQPPYELAGSTRRALEEAILSTDPRPPSDIVTQRSQSDEPAFETKNLRNRLRGDLDTIVLKALKKSPAERYPTAAAFAQDLRRYLSGDTVSARPDTFWYRITKRAHRHHSTLQGAAVAGLAAAALAVIAILNGARFSNQHTLADTLDPKSVAVLPFVDMSEKKDHEYFSDGLSEELIDYLAHTPDLKVIARTSSFLFKGKNEDAKTIGQKLGVANLLEGSVRTSGKSVRVTAQLIKVSDGSHLWSETYDRDVGDIFKVQDSIAVAVVTALQANMAKYTSSSQYANTEAHNAFLRGEYLRKKRTKQDSEHAMAAYQEAIRLDPRYARAWIRVADTYNERGIWGWMTPKSAYTEARDAIDHALSIDPNLAIAHRAISDLEWNYLFDFAAARAEMLRTRELDPVEAASDNLGGLDPLISGQFDDSIRFFREVAKRDPLSAGALADLMFALQSAGRLAEAESVGHSLLDLDPTYSGAHCNFGQVLLDAQKSAEALAIMSEEADADSRWCTADALWALGRSAEADAQFSAAMSKYSDTQAMSFAESYARRNDKEQAFMWLNRAYENRDPGITLMGADPMLRNLREDPRFAALLRKLKLPE
jgi:serine/threonine protein kinase/tetratricopeptide (TPR) repeat protein